MANFYKVLGQLDAAGSVEEVLYSVPNEWTQARVVSFVACNLDASDQTFRLRVKVANEADDDKQFIYRDQKVKPDESFVSTAVITLGPLDVLKVFSSGSNMSFGLFGSESAIGDG